MTEEGRGDAARVESEELVRWALPLPLLVPRAAGDPGGVAWPGCKSELDAMP